MRAVKVTIETVFYTEFNDLNVANAMKNTVAFSRVVSEHIAATRIVEIKELTEKEVIEGK